MLASGTAYDAESLKPITNIVPKPASAADFADNGYVLPLRLLGFLFSVLRVDFRLGGM
jgi:hypothetical protein